MRQWDHYCAILHNGRIGINLMDKLKVSDERVRDLKLDLEQAKLALEFAMGYAMIGQQRESIYMAQMRLTSALGRIGGKVPTKLSSSR
jgi:hypothetical protein